MPNEKTLPTPQRINYGSVDLKLGPDWSRTIYRDPRAASKMVAHTNGISDAYLGMEPDKLHQFAFSNKKNEDHLDGLKMKHYSYVRKSEGWIINEDVFRWDGDFAKSRGDDMMYRDASYWRAEQAQREAKESRSLNEKMDQEMAELLPSGVIAQNMNGDVLRPGTRQRIT